MSTSPRKTAGASTPREPPAKAAGAANSAKLPEKALRRAIGRPQQGAPTVGRDALLERTCELLRTVPPAQITRADVARHAGVDPALIRYYFKDTQTLLVAAAESLCARFGERMAAAAGTDREDPEQRVRSRIAALLDLEIEQPYFNRLMVETVVTSTTPEARKLMNDLNQRGVQAYRAILDEGMAAGVFRPVDGAYLYFAVIALCEFFVPGLPVLASATGGKAQVDAYRDSYRDFICDLVINGLRKTGPASRKRG
jgi:AcrR family transcriptional regulator